MSEHRGKVTTIGMFDGVHKGHRAILDALMRTAANNDADSQVVTFVDHPKVRLRPGSAPERLSTNSERRRLLEGAGVTEVLEVDFADIQPLTASEFLNRLAAQGTKVLVMGFNNTIGSDRLGAEAVRELGIMDVVEVNQAADGVSSSLIRKVLEEGKVENAARMLGRLYGVRGRVVNGKHVGRLIGFPTANMQEINTMLPKRGVYAVDVTVTGDGKTYRGMVNIGTRPTFDDGEKTTVEVNIFDYDGELYSKTLEIKFIARLRDEKRFESSEALQKALEADREVAKNVKAC